jgi:tetratricopeptide (TPR) repeat protein
MGAFWLGTRDRHELLGSTPIWESTYWGTGFWVFLLIAISRKLLPRLSRVTIVRKQSRWPIFVLLGGIIILGAYFVVPVIQGLARPFSLILVGIGFWWVIEATRWLRDMSRLPPTAPISRVSIWLPRVLLTATLLLLAKFLWVDMRQSFYVGMYHLAQLGPKPYEAQARYLAQAEALMPDDPWVHYWAACIHQAEEDYTAVLQDAAKGLSSGSRDRFIIGGLYMRQGHGHFYSGQYELALADFNQARQYGYESIVPSLAMSLVNLDREEEARQMLSTWQPLTADDYAGRAFVYHYYLLDYELALADYAQARDEGSTDYLADEIQLLMEMERPQEVQSLLQAWQPETAVDYAARADFYKSLADEEQVIRNLSEAIRLDADNPSYYYERAAAAYRSDQHAQAIADLDEAIRLDPSESVYYLTQGHATYSLGNYELAAADYTRAIESGWDDDHYIELRADAYWAIEAYDLAVADYLTLAQRHPHSEFGPEIDAAERLSQKAREFLNVAAYD